MEKLVSVVMPSCNEGIYLEKAINSILAQTYSNIEIIIVDSSDDRDTLEILNKYDSVIRCFHQPRRGIAVALNFGLEQAKGEYIARMDADDISLPQRIAMQVAFLESHPEVGVLGAQCDVINDKGEVIGQIDPGYYCDGEIKAKLIFENCIVHPTVMMRAELIKEGWRYDEGHYAEDLRLWTKMAAKGVVFSNLKEHLLLYRRSANNLSAVSTKVAPSAAASAKEYVESMFEIPVDKYAIEDFTRPYYANIITKSKSEFVISELSLLYDIYVGNIQTQKIEQQYLIRELNERWKWVFNIYGHDIFRLCRKEVFCPEVDNSVLFFEEMKKRLYVLDNQDLLLLLKDILTVNERFVLRQMHEIKTLAIYGMGIRGKKLLKEYERQYEAENLKWKLIAVSDAKEIEVECCNQKMTTIDQQQLVELNPDIVIISSNKFFDEISTELKEKGIKSRILDSNWIL